MNESMINEKPYFKMQRLPFSSKLYWGFYIASVASTAFKKIAALICSMNHVFFNVVLKVVLFLYKPALLPCCSTRFNIVVMPGPTLPFTTCICWISYKNGYKGLLVLLLLRFFNPWFIFKRH